MTETLRVSMLQRLTATVTATAAANGYHQRPAHDARTIRASLGYVRPEKQTVGGQAPRCGHEPMRKAQYSSKVQQRPLTTASQHDRQHTELAGATDKRPAAPLVRDEEAAGSNPATPTRKPQVTRHPVTCGSHSASADVRFWEPNGSEHGNGGPLAPRLAPSQCCGNYLYSFQGAQGAPCGNARADAAPRGLGWRAACKRGRPSCALILKPCKFAVKPGCAPRTTTNGRTAWHTYIRESGLDRALDKDLGGTSRKDG
jgi:hypothetical protein